MSSLGDLLTMFREVPLGFVDKSGEPEEEEDDSLQFSDVKKKEKGDAPLFQVDIFFQAPDAIEFAPSGTDFSQRIDATISEFVNMLKMVPATHLHAHRSPMLPPPHRHTTHPYHTLTRKSTHHRSAHSYHRSASSVTPSR